MPAVGAAVAECRPEFLEIKKNREQQVEEHPQQDRRLENSRDQAEWRLFN